MKQRIRFTRFSLICATLMGLSAISCGGIETDTENIAQLEQGLIVGASGPQSTMGASPAIISAPADIRDDGAYNRGMQAFDERQNVLLSAPVSVDGGGTIAAGTLVNSHMIFLNTGPGNSNAYNKHANVVWTFAGAVLGVMSNSNGSLEVASTPALGAPGTIYPTSPFNARGIEGGDGYSISGNTLTVTMQVSEPGDWMRVITEVPNHPPECGSAAPSDDALWPPNHKFVPVSVTGVTDPDGDPISITVDAIHQDEPVCASNAPASPMGYGSGNTSPDGAGVGTSTASVRAERNGNPNSPGDGRVYHIDFTASDGEGGTCTGTVTVCVPHDQGHSTCVDGGPLFDSTFVEP